MFPQDALQLPGDTGQQQQARLQQIPGGTTQPGGQATSCPHLTHLRTYGSTEARWASSILCGWTPNHSNPPKAKYGLDTLQEDVLLALRDSAEWGRPAGEAPEGSRRAWPAHRFSSTCLGVGVCMCLGRKEPGLP